MTSVASPVVNAPPWSQTITGILPLWMKYEGIPLFLLSVLIIHDKILNSTGP